MQGCSAKANVQGLRRQRPHEFVWLCSKLRTKKSVWEKCRSRRCCQVSVQVCTEVRLRPPKTHHVSEHGQAVNRSSKQGEPLSTLLFNSLAQNILKPIAETWKSCNHGVRLAEHDPNTNLSNLIFADDKLHVSSSREAHDHHASRPYHSYDSTRPTTPLHENSNHLQYDIKARKKQHCGSSRHKHRDPTARREKSSTPVNISFSKTPYTSSLNCIKCAWATFTSHRQELT